MTITSTSIDQQISSQIKHTESLITQLNTSFQSFQSQLSSQWLSIQSSLSLIQTFLLSKQSHLISLDNKPTCENCNNTTSCNAKLTDNVVVKLKDHVNLCSNDYNVMFNVTLDGRTLQMFLNDKINHGVSAGHYAKNENENGDDVFHVLKLSSDPGKLVLDAMEGFFPPRLIKGGVEYGESVVRRTCVMLLENVMRLGPEIKEEVRKEAKRVAKEWRKKMRGEGEGEGRDVVVLGILLLVVVYGLAAEFDKDEFRRLCEVVHQHRLSGEIRSRLGLLRLKVGPLHRCEASSTSVQSKEKELDNENNSNKETEHNNYDYNHHHHPPAWFSQMARAGKNQLHSDSLKFGLQSNQENYDTSKSNNLNNDNKHLHHNPPARFSTLAGSGKVQRHLSSPQIGLSPVSQRIKNIVSNKSRHHLPAHFSSLAGSVKAEMHSILPPFSMGTSRWTVPGKEKLHTSHVTKTVKSPLMESFPDLRSLCKKMETDGLKSYLVEHMDDLNSINEKVLDSLRWASEPAKLVLDVLRGLYQESNGIQCDMYQSCCNFLLELLLKLSQDISTALREESIIFASIWKTRLAKQGNKPLHVFGFLKFLTAYKLANAFEADDLLSLFSTFYNGDDIYERKQNPELCRALGLDAKIPDLIHSLIKDNRQLEAVRYICAFNLADRFPPAPLLKAHLEHAEANALKKFKYLNASTKAQNKCASRQKLALQGVIRCIIDFNLESEYSLIDLQQRIRQLEKEKKERKASKLENEKAGNHKRSTPLSCEELHRQAKQPRGDPENFGSPDVSIAINSDQLGPDIIPSRPLDHLPAGNIENQQFTGCGTNHGLSSNVGFGKFQGTNIPSATSNRATGYTNFSSSMPPVATDFVKHRSSIGHG